MTILLAILAFQQQPAMVLRLEPAAGTVVRHRMTVQAHGAPLSMTMQSTTRVLSRSDSGALMEITTVPDTGGAAVDTVLYDNRGGSLVLSTGRRILPVFPSHAVRLGDSWTDSSGLDSLISLERDSLQHLIATISTHGRLDLPSVDGVSSSGTVHVVSRYDLTAGILLFQRNRSTGMIDAEGVSVPIEFVMIVERVP